MSGGAPQDLVRIFYPETAVGGFSRLDGTIEFFTRIAALLEPSDRVLDFGAGRGSFREDDRSPFRNHMRTLRGRVARVDGCDYDAAVLGNESLDHATVIKPGEPLDYGDGVFDLVVASWVFEHVEHPHVVVSELLRVTRPGGWICAVTPNGWSYPAILARLVANRKHAGILKSAQPHRKSIDVFPTFYRMNKASTLRTLFDGRGEVFVYAMSSEPAYHFNSRLVFRVMTIVHRLLPEFFATALFVFIRKYDDRSQN